MRKTILPDFEYCEKISFRIHSFRTISKVLVYIFCSKRIDFRAILRNTLETPLASPLSAHPYLPLIRAGRLRPIPQRYPPRGTLLKNLSSPENTLTHQIGFTRTNCAWIALNLLLNILMCYLVLQTSPRPNEISMNPYYGPNTIPLHNLLQVN